MPDTRATCSSARRRMDVDDLIRMAGHCDDMPAAFAAADFVAVPAIEPPLLGRVVAQAQAMGRPVVTTDVGMLRGAYRGAAAHAGGCAHRLDGDDRRSGRLRACVGYSRCRLSDGRLSPDVRARTAIRGIHVFAGERCRRDAVGLYVAPGARSLVVVETSSSEPAVRCRTIGVLFVSSQPSAAGRPAQSGSIRPTRADRFRAIAARPSPRQADR